MRGKGNSRALIGSLYPAHKPPCTVWTLRMAGTSHGPGPFINRLLTQSPGPLLEGGREGREGNWGRWLAALLVQSTSTWSNVHAFYLRPCPASTNFQYTRDEKDMCLAPSCRDGHTNRS